MLSNFFAKIVRLWDKVPEEYDGAREAADNMAHARRMLNK